MNPEAILASFREALGAHLIEDRTVERRVGTMNPQPVYDLWIHVKRDSFHDAVAHLCQGFAPHLSVISGDDLGDEIALNYHFTTGWGERFGEKMVSLRVLLPKTDLRIPTITDLLPGAQTSEREKHEFYGIVVDGIPDDRNLFLPEDMTIHPWRKDEAEEIEALVKRTVKWETRDE